MAQLGSAGSDRKIRPNDFLIFNQQFNTLVKAGLPILRALDLLAERAAAPRLRPILTDVRQRVREGALLSEALAAQGSFPPVYVTVITAGERSGNLTGVLEQYIAYLRVSTGFRSRLITAMIYPAVLVAVAILVVTYVVTYAMPQFASLYHELGVPLPAPTRILLSVALPLRTYFLILIAIIAMAAVAIFLWTQIGARRACNRPTQAPHTLFRRHLGQGSNCAVHAHAFDASRRRNSAGAGSSHILGGHG